MYQNFFNLLNTYLYNGEAALSPATDLTCTLLASFGSVLLVALPFFMVYSILKVFF